MQKRINASWLSCLESQPTELVIDKSINFRYDSVAVGLIFYNHRKIKLQSYLCVHGNDVRRITFSEYLSDEIVPEGTDFWVFSCSDIYSPHSFIKVSPCPFTSLFIPKIPDINIKLFTGVINKTSKILEDNICKDEDIHCILLFTLVYPNSIINKFTKELFSRENIKTMAIGGGVISRAFTQSKYKTAQFDAFSVVISDNDDFKAKLIDFKSLITLRKSSCAIRICCAAKGAKDMETAVFNEIFPDTFIVGLDADGEIGCNKYSSWQPQKDAPDEKKQKISHSLCHQYTTIIMILTWGKRI
ncbi:hypothetical protein Trydic_g16620 [Trypoxylus dichotomus]